MTLSTFERFERRVDAEGDCWLWTGGKNDLGYGVFHDPIKRKHVMAYRWLWEYLIGPIPDGLEIDHLCRVPSCVNPDHLEPVTHRENLRRSKRPGVGDTCRHGHPRGLENEYHWRRKDGRLFRVCRTCHLEKTRAYKRRIRS